MGAFPRLGGTTRGSDVLPSVPLRFVSFARRYHPRLDLRSRHQRAADAEPGLVKRGALPRSVGGDSRTSQVPGDPSCGVPRSQTPPGPKRLTLAALRCGRRYRKCTPAPATEFLFGVQSRGLSTPCVRFAADVAVAPRNTRFRLVASLCRAGLESRRDPSKGFSSSASSFPRLCLAHSRREPPGRTTRIRASRAA